MAENRTKEIFEAIKTRNAVLLNGILETMNSSERADMLASDQYGSGEFPHEKSPLTTAVQNEDLDSVKVLLKYKAGIEVREELFLSAANGNTDILRSLIENGADVNVCTPDHNRTPLMIAIENGHINVVTFLIQHGANVTLKDDCGDTALYYACMCHGSLEVVSCLIENGADVNAYSAYNCTPLMIAIENGHINVVTFLIQHGANVTLKDNSGYTALHYACMKNDSLEVLSCLIENGADVNACSDKGYTPLMMASENGHSNAVTFLTEHGANVALTDDCGETALHFALQFACMDHGSLEVLNSLIENGADVNACSNNYYTQRTPLKMAIENDYINAAILLIECGAYAGPDDYGAIHLACIHHSSLEVLSCLLENGADINQPLEYKDTALMIAARVGHINVVTFLIEHGANVNIQGNGGLTALHYAVRFSDGSCEVLRCLIENGADINAESNDSKTPLIIAVEKGLINVVTFLTEYGANVDLQDKDGQTALHYAVRFFEGSCEILCCFIKNGADVNAGSNYSETPLMIAVKKGLINVVTFLTEHGANVDLQDKHGKTALHYAVHASNALCEILSCLIKNGADVNAHTLRKETPLMLASFRGEVNAVTFLIEHGATVDLQDKDGQTALHYAVCFSDGSCEVLRCLIENGADINAESNDSKTPLIIAAKKGLINVVTFLTEHGANMHLQDKDGNTALHYAARSDFPEIVNTLLTLGASHKCNNQGLTPLLLASSTGGSEVVEYLIKRPEITNEQRIDALELLGATLATQQKTLFYSGVNKGLKYIKGGMQERFANSSKPLLKQLMEPVEAYENRKESQTLQELAEIERDRNAIFMESLIIRERILGTNNVELLHSIRFVASRRDDPLIDPSIRMALYRRAVEIAQKSNQSASADLQNIGRLLYEKCRGSNHLKEKDLLELLRQTVIEYETQHTKKKRNDDKKYHRFLEPLFGCSVQLVSFIPKLEFCEKSNSSNVSVLLRKLFRQDPRDRFGNSLLHEVIGMCMEDDAFHQAVNLLLNEGFNVNVTNNNGDTPLHIAVTYTPNNDKIHVLTDMLEVLLDRGAHHDFVNNDGETPMDLAQTDEARMILSERRKLELKCISARAVKKFGIPYLGVVPKILEKYICRH